MRTAMLALSTAFLLSACAMPAQEKRSADWENNAYLLTQPAADY